MTHEAVIKARGGFSLSIVPRDLAQGLSKTALWTAFAWDEIQNRYRRSRLGLIWIVLSYLIFVLAIAMFFGGFSRMGGGSFTVHVAYNYAIFGFMVANVTDGCEVFRVARSWIKSTTLPHAIFVYKSIARSLFTFVLNLTVAILVAWYLGMPPTWLALLSVPAFLVLLINAVWIQLVFGYAASRYRDLAHLTSALTRLLFFLTPIIWVLQERTGLTRKIAELNPFTHALEIFTAPLMGRMPDMHSWVFILVVTLVGSLLSVIVGGVAHRRLPFWL